MKRKVFLYVGLIMTIVMAVAVGTACSSPEPFLKEDLVRLLSDGKYDSDFALLELKGYDVAELKKWVRPIITRVTNEGGKLFMEKEGMGVLFADYVITSRSAIFIAEEMPPPPTLPGEPPIEMSPFKLESSTFLIWDIKFNPTIGGSLFIEPLQLVFSEKGTDIVIFKRTDTVKYPIAPLSYYQIGKPEELGKSENWGGPEKLITIGYEDYLSKESLAQPIKEASFTAHWQDQHGFLFQGSISSVDFGAPVFAIFDGKPELAGIVTASGAAIGIETQALAINIDYVAKVVKEKIGIDIMSKGE